MSTKDLNELLGKYDKLLSVANSGSSDRSISLKFKTYKRLLNNKLLKKISINTYVAPFASNQIRKEVRQSLTYILRLYEINYLRTERSDKSSREAIDIINEYLKKIPKHGISLEDRLKNNFWNILATTIGIPSLILSIWSSTLQLFLIIIGAMVLFVSIPFVASDITTRVFRYSVERKWYKNWMKKLTIEDLKNKIAKELVELNDKTYAELDTKYP